MASPLSADGPPRTTVTSPHIPLPVHLPAAVQNGGEDTHGVAHVIEKLDIEHQVVQDDPRNWSNARKNVVLCIISSAAMIAGLAGNIYNPGIDQIKEDLHATSSQISLSLSLFILIQGAMPLLWSVVSEVKGRKIVYIVSISIAIIGCIVSAVAKSIGALIGSRCLQAIGSSAVIAIGAATLADIYDPVERGRKMGIYYAAPLLGPSLGPIIGGVLTQFLSWRATFWFMVIWMSFCLVMFSFFFKDTFRRERSLTYQAVLRRHVAHRQRVLRSRSSKRSSMTFVGTPSAVPEDQAKELSSAPLPVNQETRDIEACVPTVTVAAAAPPMHEIKLSVADVNPLPPLFQVLRRWNNVTILTSSGFIFGFTYSITYTCAITLEDGYQFNALKTGLVLLSFGVGSMAGSILGGRWSDHVLSTLKAKNNGQSYPEMRLESTKWAMLFFPLAVIAYAWLADKHIHVAALCVALFFAGFFSIWIYSSTLAYIVDANKGRSSSAVATNSCFRGSFAFVFSEAAVPLRNAIGDGGLYSLWTGLTIVSELLLLLVLYRGGVWREKEEERERSKDS